MSAGAENGDCTMKNLPNCTPETVRADYEAQIARQVSYEEDRTLCISCNSCMASMPQAEAFACANCGEPTCVDCVDEVETDLFSCSLCKGIS